MERMKEKKQFLAPIESDNLSTSQTSKMSAWSEDDESYSNPKM